MSLHLGRFADGRRFLATIDPWHGTRVSVCRETSAGSLEFEPREVLDDKLHDGHALWLADVDADGDDEVFAGWRGEGTSVTFYDYQNGAWNRTVLDPALAAQDLRGGDLSGNGKKDDVVAIGRDGTVVWFRPIQPGKDQR